MLFNVFFSQCASMCFNVFSMCFSHIENKWSRDAFCDKAIKLVFSSCEFDWILCSCPANWYAFTTHLAHYEAMTSIKDWQDSTSEVDGWAAEATETSSTKTMWRGGTRTRNWTRRSSRVPWEWPSPARPWKIIFLITMSGSRHTRNLSRTKLRSRRPSSRTTLGLPRVLHCRTDRAATSICRWVSGAISARLFQMALLLADKSTLDNRPCSNHYYYHEW